MQKENLYKKMQDAIDSLPENFSVLEEQVDIQLQMEYFSFNRDPNHLHFDNSRLNEYITILYNKDSSIVEKKKILILLASQDNVEAYRIIEKYVQTPDIELTSWSVLALQESRMVIQSSIMDEQQVYISTGLGGKGQKLRYFIVLISREELNPFTNSQRKLIKNEFKFAISKIEIEMEKIKFHKDLVLISLLIPVKADIQNFLVGILNECNQYGDFISPDLIITNVKKLSIPEIRHFFQNKN